MNDQTNGQQLPTRDSLKLTQSPSESLAQLLSDLEIKLNSIAQNIIQDSIPVLNLSKLSEYRQRLCAMKSSLALAKILYSTCLTNNRDTYNYVTMIQLQSKLDTLVLTLEAIISKCHT